MSHKKAIEETKIVIEYVKHVNTLSTGSLVLLIAFLEKIFKEPKFESLIVISLISFACSIIGSVCVLTVNAAQPNNTGKAKWAIKLEDISIVAMWLGFVLGVVSLTAFSVFNIG